LPHRLYSQHQRRRQQENRQCALDSGLHVISLAFLNADTVPNRKALHFQRL
jgi:hypothetical protein